VFCVDLANNSRTPPKKTKLRAWLKTGAIETFVAKWILIFYLCRCKWIIPNGVPFSNKTKFAFLSGNIVILFPTTTVSRNDSKRHLREK
jgi:hypothetical protein